MLTTCAIILDYFGSDKTVSCLKSLLDQSLDTVVVVDNSGDQQAKKELKDVLSEFQQRKTPFKIHLIVNQKNLGFAAGVNAALSWIENHKPHHYYLLMNNDAEATPGMLPELVRYIREHENTAIVAPLINIGQKRISGFWYHRLSGLMFSRHVAGSFPYLTGCCLLVDRRIVDDGLFDEDFFMYGEDVELSWRLYSSGFEMVCVNQAVVQHEGAGSSSIGGLFYEYHMVLAHLLLSQKLASIPFEKLFFYLGRIPTLSVRAVLRAIRFRSLVPVQATVSALRSNINFKKVLGV